MLISTAPFLSGLACETLTFDRRLKGWGWPGYLALWNCGTSFSRFCVVLVFISGARLTLRKLQEMKSIKMVRKYRDRRGRPRVATWQFSKWIVSKTWRLQTCQSQIMIETGVHQTNILRNVQPSCCEVGAKDLKSSQVYPYGFCYHVSWWHDAWLWHAMWLPLCNWRFKEAHFYLYGHIYIYICIYIYI